MSMKRVPMGKMNKAVLFRVLRYVFRDYKWHFLLVLLCIFTTTFATLQSTLFTRTLIDEYITPLIGTANPDFGPLFSRLVTLACILMCGVVASYVNTKTMATIGQGTLERLRVELFTHMESLPIR